MRLIEAHGVTRYPFGTDGVIDLSAAKRSTPSEKPQIEVSSNIAFTLEVRWPGGSETREIAAGHHTSNVRCGRG